jgi:conjugative transposon TraN protein
MKKTIFLLAAFLGMATDLFAQQDISTLQSDLPEILIGKSISLHFISPEPIKYVDISSRSIVGDLPVNNVLRVKVIPDSLAGLMHADPGTVVTIIGESFIAQYRLRLAAAGATGVCTQVEISQQQMKLLDISSAGMTTPELKTTALAILSERRDGAVRRAQAYEVELKLNHMYTVGDLLFLDLAFTNHTKLLFDTDQLRFKIEDRRITKATNVQSVEVQPLWQLYPESSFQRNRRNIYVLKKITFPENKVLSIELNEKQISGRNLTLKIKYSDVLHADTF